MADIKVRGYVNRPAQKTGANGAFSTFSLSEKVKDKKEPKGHRYTFYNVTDFNSSEPPKEGSFVSVQGWFKQREYEKDGVKRSTLDITASSVEVSPPRDGAPAVDAPADGPAPDPWELG